MIAVAAIGIGGMMIRIERGEADVLGRKSYGARGTMGSARSARAYSSQRDEFHQLVRFRNAGVIWVWLVRFTLGAGRRVDSRLAELVVPALGGALGTALPYHLLRFERARVMRPAEDSGPYLFTEFKS
jgi:hypothetical protein